MGFLLFWVDEEYGGVGFKDFCYEQIMCEELVWINELGFMILLYLVLCGLYIVEYGSVEQKVCLLLGIVCGEIIFVVVMIELFVGFDLVGMCSIVVDKGDYWLFNGFKVFIFNGLLVDLVIVVVKIDLVNKYVMGLFLVECGM